MLAAAPVLAGELVRRLLELCPADTVEAYGKSAVVGLGGEIEHASALIHTLRFGNVFRDAVGGTSYLNFTNTRSPAGAMVSLPMTHKTVVGKRSHFLTLNFCVSDAPDRDEILVAIGASDGGRVHPRIGDRFQDMEEMGIAPKSPEVGKRCHSRYCDSQPVRFRETFAASCEAERPAVDDQRSAAAGQSAFLAPDPAAAPCTE